MKNNGHFTVLTDDNFDEEVINSDKPVLVQYSAEWSGTRYLMESTLEEIAEKYHELVKMTKLDFEKNKCVTQKFGIWRIPRFLLFNKGEIVDIIHGAVPMVEMERRIQKVLE
ncbi:thioredoxin [bacterium]|nr:thioredoxin [bacterium]MBU1653036.1 thioredoxin [bacterium]MBU1881891.1 thioredoxin [bacterium]